MIVNGTGLGCGVYKLGVITANTTGEDIDRALANFRYNGRYPCAFIYTIVKPTWKKVIAELTKRGFNMGIKNKAALVMLMPRPKPPKKKKVASHVY